MLEFANWIILLIMAMGWAEISPWVPFWLLTGKIAIDLIMVFLKNCLNIHE